MSLEILFNYEKCKIKNKDDAIVCAIHYFLITRGYKCVAKGEEQRRDNSKKSDMLPSGWADDDVYALIYQQECSSDNFVLKIVKFDSILLVNFLRFKDEKVSSVEVKLTEYVENDLSSYETAFKNLDKFWKILTAELLGPFVDKAKKSPPRSVPESQSSVSDSPRHEPHRPDPLRAPHNRREWEEHRDPFMIGRSDLDPLAGGMGSGMIFDPMRSGIPMYGPFGGGTGGPNRLPRGAVPPGARFDPFGPPDLDPNGSRYPNHRNPRSGPDPDHLPPPGYSDMFM